MQRVIVGGLIAFALLFSVSNIVGSGTVETRSVMAQDATPVATVGTEPAQPAVQPAQRADNNDDGFPWGLLGLAGLAGLAGLRRPEQVNVQTERVAPKVGMYENTKK